MEYNRLSHSLINSDDFSYKIFEICIDSFEIEFFCMEKWTNLANECLNKSIFKFLASPYKTN